MIQPQNTKYVPLFEEHKLLVQRINSLPENILADLGTILSLDENAIICGSLGMYLTGMSEEMPNGVDVIVSDATKMKLVEHGMVDDENRPFEIEDEDDGCGCGNINAQEQAGAPAVGGMPVLHQEGPQHQEGAQIEVPAEGTVVIMHINPEGAIQDVNQPEDGKPKGHYDDDGNFHFEGFTWMNGKPEGSIGKVGIFECKAKIKTMPMALGNITVLVEDPGVMSEYRMKFAKLKAKGKKSKQEKKSGYDTKKQPHVKGGADLQDAPSK